MTVAKTKVLPQVGNTFPIGRSQIHSNQQLLSLEGMRG